MIAMFPEDKHAVEVQSQPSPNVAKTQQIQLSAIAIDDFGDFVAQSHASNNSDFRDQYTVSSLPHHTHTLSHSHTCMHICDSVEYHALMYRRWTKMLDSLYLLASAPNTNASTDLPTSQCVSQHFRSFYSSCRESTVHL